ncbi:TPR and ankyrin repeat-containing protein 1 isoform X2 [Amblyraja radiata]|uniref:TPR and ankyrin repeat-containing protein 1 isoform X2 n=1 Tax=Amblyraja radiata TaxID=386614 RepID=UPI001403805A|nr:TPR and ankyrin repeat-containing protein 1 isoform X2 [Amblyraja radiata]
MDQFVYVMQLKHLGNEAFKQQNYHDAIQRYDDALRILQVCQPAGRELAVLFCNRSNAFYNLEMWDDAFVSAHYATAMDNTYIKGYYWAGSASLKRHDNTLASQFFYEGLNILDGDREKSQYQIADFIVGILTANGADANSDAIFKWKKYNLLIWQTVIDKAAKKYLWESLYFLLCEYRCIPGNNYRASGIPLKNLFERIPPGIEPMHDYKWITKLLRALVTHGVNLETIGPFPLHSILKLAIRTNDKKLLKWIFEKKPSLQDKINHWDEDGQLLLHIVASWNTTANGYDRRCQTEDVRFLLQSGADPSISNRLNKFPADYLKKNKNFTAVDSISQHCKSSSPNPAFEEAANQMKGSKSVSPATTFEEACTQLVQFCDTLDKDKPCKDLLAQTPVQIFLQQLSAQTEISTATISNIDQKFANNLIKQLIHKCRWDEALLLLSGESDEKQGKEGVLKFDFSDLDLCTVACNLDQHDNNEWLLQRLIHYGASPCGIGTKKSPIQISLNKDDFKLVHFLLKNGANPCDITMMPGDTPLHAAVYIVLDKKDEFGLHILKYLLEKYSSDDTSSPYFNTSSQDQDGNTVLHIIFQKPFSKNHEEIMDLITKFEINDRVKNKEGKQFSYKIKKDDPRFILWNKVKLRNRRKREQIDQSQKARTSKGVKNVMNRKWPTQQTMEMSNVPLSKMYNLNDSNPPAELAGHEILMNEIEILIQKLNVIEAPTEENPLNMTLPDSQLNNSTPPLQAKSEVLQTNGFQTTDRVEAAMLNGTGDGMQQNRIPDEVTNIQDLDFDNMTWEIECTPEVLKKLGSKDVPQQMKAKIITVIQQLGNGEWTQSLQKLLKHLKSPIKLYEAKLDKGARMLWELAVDFSPRCSEKPEKIFESEFSSHSQERVTGRIYSEIIRIWDIILDHNKLDRALIAIDSSYNRGASCSLRKKLKGISKAVFSSNLNAQKRIPLIFVEYVNWKELKEKLPEYFPPASSVETEYNIMKFHSFSTNMALNIITNLESRVEYPFRVGELEYAIIDLDPKPLEAIILIGRSGTGKTTCCLYRLWKSFQLYWKKAEEVGCPLLVRQIWHKTKSMVGDEKEAAVIEGTDQSDCVKREECIHCQDQSGNLDLNGPAASICDDESTYDHEDRPENSTGTDRLEHLHQIFITKNHVLCQEVLKNFIELTKSTKATKYFKPPSPMFYRLQDVKDENFPLFLTSKQLLLMIDASLPEPFFARNEDGSLKRNIVGWSVQEEMTIPDLRDEDEEEEYEGDFLDDEQLVAEEPSKEFDPRIFITYEVFAHDIWPKMVKGKPQFNPALVWKEIKSFLKGSVEALTSPQGCLTEELYIKLGKKRAPNFHEDRTEIYAFFHMYQQIKSQWRYFDEEDLLFSLTQRLAKLDEIPWSIHELYGDEIQDFTQAELATLMKCINDPNAMFLTGDTAQSIMKGVAFRFSDLRSLFYYARDSSQGEKKQHIVRVPSRIYQLHQNYRSHSGILNLASSVVDLLQQYFPESFDRLPRDTSLFDGPKPSLLESCSVSDLAILLRGNKRKSQPIEFGAHQVILVVNETAKDTIPEELSLALVLTIYEAKGLEFDDVLLYNFFTDSEADKEWRVISSFQPSLQLTDNQKVLLEQPLDDIIPQIRPLEFNSERHKLLNCELKQLYTAFTRARVNLWVFDENKGKRAPAFEYFIKRQFVNVVKTNENKELDDSMFVKASTNQEWAERGDYFAKHQCWKVAVKCYQKGGEMEKEKLAQAHDAVLNIQVKKKNLKEIQLEYLQLAKTYLECKVPKLSLKCLRNAKEYKLCAQLLEKLGKVGEAAGLYRRAQCYKQSMRCYEQLGQFKLALKMLCCGELYEEAAWALSRYEVILHEKKEPQMKLPYSVDQFRLEAAAKYLRENKLAEMIEALSLLDLEDQLAFLKSNKRLPQAAELLKSRGRAEEAAILMREHGKLQEAARLSNKKEFQAECLVAAARVALLKQRKEEISTMDKQSIQEMLDEATALLKIKKELSSQFGEAMLLNGLLNEDALLIGKALDIFVYENNAAGAMESLFYLIQKDHTASSCFEQTLTCLELLVTLKKALDNPQNNAEKEMVKACYAFFGIVPVDAKYCRVPLHEGVWFFQIDFDSSKLDKQDGFYQCEMKKTKILLQKHLLLRLCDFAEQIKSAGLKVPDICPKFICGLPCTDQSCQDYHKTLKRHEAKSSLEAKIYLTVLNGILLEAKHFWPSNDFPEVEKIDDILTGNQYALCISMLNAFYPKHFHRSIISTNPAACWEVLGLVKKIKYQSFRSVLREYLDYCFKCASVKKRRESTDLWFQAQQVYLLTSDYLKIDDLLSKEEQAYDSERRKSDKVMDVQDKKMKPRTPNGRLGMLPTKTLHLCIFRLLIISMKTFFESSDPERCIHNFYRFMNVLVKRCVDPLIPSIPNTIMVLELQFVLCCSVLMHLAQNVVVYLPRSFIALLHYWNFMFKGQFKLTKPKNSFSIINEYKPKDVPKAIHKIKQHLSFLARVLCGEENKNFNVLLDAFSHADYYSSGEAERTLVLCLVMLINTPQVLEPWAVEMIMCSLRKVEKLQIKVSQDHESKVPARLRELLEKVNGAQTVGDIASNLQELLSKRDDENLHECVWKWDHYSGPGYVRGIYFRNLHIEKFTDECQTKIDEIVFFQEKDVAADVTEDLEEKDDCLQVMASQLQKAIVRKKWQRLLHVIAVCRYLPMLLTQAVSFTAQQMEEVPSNFKEAQVDETQCDICGVKFTRTAGSYDSREQECEESIDQSSENWEVNKDEERGEDLCSHEYFQNHIGLEEHKRKEDVYKAYLAYFRRSVEAIMSKGRNVLNTLEDMGTQHLTYKELSKVKYGKLKSSMDAIVDSIDTIYDQKIWIKGEEILTPKVEDLQKIVDSTDLWRKQSSNLNDYGLEVNQSTPDFEGEEDGHENFDELCSKKKKKSSKRRKR